MKHMRVASPLLSAFWGREMWLGAIVLLPEGFDEHPDARYPLMIHHVSPTNTRSITLTYGAYSGAYAMNHSMMNSNRDESSFVCTGQHLICLRQRPERVEDRGTIRETACCRRRRPTPASTQHPVPTLRRKRAGVSTNDGPRSGTSRAI